MYCGVTPCQSNRNAKVKTYTAYMYINPTLEVTFMLHLIECILMLIYALSSSARHALNGQWHSSLHKPGRT